MVFINPSPPLDNRQQNLRGAATIHPGLSQRDRNVNQFQNELWIHLFTSFPSLKSRIAFARSVRFFVSCSKYRSGGTFVAIAPRYVSQESRATLYDLISVLSASLSSEG